MVVPLCRAHRIEVATRISADVAADVGAWPALLAEASRAPADLNGKHDHRVYFARNGSRVKIGTTTNLGTRVANLCLPRESIALVLHGDRLLEAAIHDHFSQYRIPRTEWFDYSDEIAEYMAAKRLEHVDQSSPALRSVPPSRGRATPETEAIVEAAKIIVRYGIASATMLQSRMSMGYARATRVIRVLQAAGVVGDISGPGQHRKVMYKPSETDAAQEALGSYLARQK